MEPDEALALSPEPELLLFESPPLAESPLLLGALSEPESEASPPFGRYLDP